MTSAETVPALAVMAQYVPSPFAEDFKQKPKALHRKDQ